MSESYFPNTEQRKKDRVCISSLARFSGISCHLLKVQKEAETLTILSLTPPLLFYNSRISSMVIRFWYNTINNSSSRNPFVFYCSSWHPMVNFCKSHSRQATQVCELYISPSLYTNTGTLEAVWELQASVWCITWYPDSLHRSMEVNSIEISGCISLS